MKVHVQTTIDMATTTLNKISIPKEQNAMVLFTMLVNNLLLKMPQESFKL
jgi:hypothetical protein